ncbi:hypothetical protein [Roseovarius Plymouth podovirus 1]|uniref:Uncharacterized protein n=2 Tax=Roseovarius Plymouth podovirus 1 TaxID=926474 RepID=K4Q4T8_9CAUD|nr:hypothetical protein HYO70_gp04 [Roseovarius Plymouth podovirus 1]CBW46997.1 hypothetical protein [Roseovarius sp. 217 phage 1]CBX87934.1 hypothetical protein [Roseovarius Plymouth podovirus 1]
MNFKHQLQTRIDIHTLCSSRAANAALGVLTAIWLTKT